MFCVNCGQTLPPGAAFCPNCGQKAETPSPDAPAAKDVCGQPDHAVDGAPEKIESFMNYAIIITVLAALKCGTIINLVLGIAAIVYANKVDQNIQTGNYDKARECAQTAKMLCLVATVLIAVQVLIVALILIALLTCSFLPLFLH